MEVQVRKATWLELFYDLVFVVAIAKAVHTLGHVHNGHIAADLYGKYLLIMVPLWWAWTGHGCGFNRSMQHLISNYREEDVVNEVSIEDLLHRDR